MLIRWFSSFVDAEPLQQRVQRHGIGCGVGAGFRPPPSLVPALALGAVASRPFLVPKVGEALAGRKLTDEAIEEAAATVASRAKPMDNADMDLYWRKEVVSSFTAYALRELRGDDMRAVRLRTARQIL